LGLLRLVKEKGFEVFVVVQSGGNEWRTKKDESVFLRGRVLFQKKTFVLEDGFGSVFH